MQTVYKDIQLLPSLSHVQSDGSGIGGVDPAAYSSEVLKTSLFMYTSGAKTPGYPAWMWYPATPLPLVAGAVNVNLEIEFIIGGTISSLNAIETDVLIVTPNAAGVMQKFNRSAQFVQGKGFQVAAADGSWVETGINPGPLQAYSTHRLEYEHTFSTSQDVSSTVALSFNGVSSLVPEALQNVASAATNWSPAGIYIQLQQGSLPAAEPWTLKIKKLKVTQS